MNELGESVKRVRRIHIYLVLVCYDGNMGHMCSGGSAFDIRIPNQYKNKIEHYGAKKGFEQEGVLIL